MALLGAEALSFTAVPLKSKAPPYSPHRNDPRDGDNIGMRVADPRSGKVLFYAPGLGAIEPQAGVALEHERVVQRNGVVGHLARAGGELIGLLRVLRILLHGDAAIDFNPVVAR